MLIAYGIMATHGKAQLKNNDDKVSDYQPHAHHKKTGIENSLSGKSVPTEPHIGDIELGKRGTKVNTKSEFNLDDIDERIALHRSGVNMKLTSNTPLKFTAKENGGSTGYVWMRDTSEC